MKNVNILKEGKRCFFVNVDGIEFWTEKSNIINGMYSYTPKEIKEYSEFWKDVMSRVGMDVCTPFMNKFPGHSFVAYDNNTVWSSTLKTIFTTKPGVTVGFNRPKSCKSIIKFGSETIK